jgi:hypothetical protein
MTALNWFHRTCGSWRSERRYLFSPTSSKASNLTVDFTIDSQDLSNEFRVEWSGQTSGVMDICLEGDTLHRSRDYFGDEAHSSQVSMIDQDTIVMTTTYGGITYREEIRLLQSDNYRLRQTIGFDGNGKAALVGQYFERRV